MFTDCLVLDRKAHGVIELEDIVDTYQVKPTSFRTRHYRHCKPGGPGLQAGRGAKELEVPPS